MLGGMIALYFLSYFQRVAVPGTVFNELQLDFKASAGAITTLGALFLYIYGFWQIFAGLLADRFGGLRMLLIGGVLMTAGALVFPLAHSLTLLYTTRMLLAFGASFMYISMVKELDTLFARRHFAILLSALLFFGYSGGLCGTLPLERAVNCFGWRASFLAIGALTAGVLLGNFWLAKITRRTHTPHRQISRLLIKDILRNRHSWNIIIPSAINFSIYFLIQTSIGKKMLSDACGANSSQAAAIMFCMLLTCMIFTSLSGFLSRLIGNRRKPLIIGGTSLTLAVLVFMLWILAKPTNTAGLMATGCILLGVSVSISPLLACAMKEVNPEEAAATSIGLGNCLSYLCVAIVTNIAGLVMDAFSAQAVATTEAIIYPAGAYRMILLGCIIIAAISWGSAFWIVETHGRGAYQRTKKNN